MRTCEVVLKPSGELCPRKHYAKGMCWAHYMRDRRDGDVRADVPVRDRASHTPDDPSYHAVHQRLRTQRGKADEHDCVGCGDQARNWSYDHTDPDERTSDQGCPYSDDLDRYDPRCASCHTTFDTRGKV